MTRRVAGAACAAALLVASAPSCRSTSTDSAIDAGGLPTAEPIELGFQPDVLERLADEAGQHPTRCFLVARQGRVVLARYWDGATADSAQEVFSVTKSVTSTLVGLAQADGWLSIDDSAARYIDDWRGTPSEDVTVRHLLSNDSGRFWSPESDNAGLLEATDRTAYAVALDQQEEPGSVWAYNNAAIQTLDAVLRSATGADPATFAGERLFEPLGMTHTRMTEDESGHSTNVFFGLQTTCPDLARFGTMFAQEGEWEGERLLPRAWVEDAVGRSSQQLNAAYGLLWWVNRTGPVRAAVDPADPDEPPGLLQADQVAPGAPEELFAAQGLGGQILLVDPRTDTVVVRLGGAEDEGPDGYLISDAARVVTEALSPLLAASGSPGPGHGQ